MKKTYPLSHAQLRVWYTQKKYPDNAMFHIGGTVEIKGEVNAERLRRAISRVICTNDAFRLRFRTQGNGAVQYLYEGEPEIELLDLSGEADPELAYERLCADMFQEPFILEGGRMYRFLVCRLRKNKTVYFVKLHHLIADGWSMKLLTEQITSAYEMPDMSCGMQPSYLEHVAAELSILPKPGGGAAEKSGGLFQEQAQSRLPAANTCRLSGIREEASLAANGENASSSASMEASANGSTAFLLKTI